MEKWVKKRLDERREKRRIDEGRERERGRYKINLKRKLAKVSATFKGKRIDLPENRVRG